MGHAMSRSRWNGMVPCQGVVVLYLKHSDIRRLHNHTLRSPCTLRETVDILVAYFANANIDILSSIDAAPSAGPFTIESRHASYKMHFCTVSTRSCCA